MANLVYNKGIAELFKALTDLDVADLRVLLVQTSYTPDPDHAFVDDVSADEVTVSGYSRQTLTGEAVTQDDTNDQVYLDADDPVFSGMAAGENIGGAILFRHTGSDATAPVLAFYDLGSIATSVGSLTVKWAAPASGGVLQGVSA